MDKAPAFPRLPLTLVLRACAAVLAGAAGAHALADGQRAATPLLPAYRDECASCHVAYPPALLPAPSWQRLMQDLANHFGTDATVDAATREQLGAWLTAHAGSGKRAREAPPGERITRSAWFVREHREVAAATWQSPLVKSPANCSACHPRADEGDFDEHRVRIPR